MTYAFDSELAPMLEFLPPVGMDDPVAARTAFSSMAAQMNAELDTSGVTITDRDIPGPAGAPDVPIRIYSPEGLDSVVPGLLFMHGGGFVLGNRDSEQGSCVLMCRALGIVIVSVDYRLSPETAFPGPLDDCYAALEWVAAQAAELQIDAARIGVFGQSAGGCLSAAVALLSRDRNGPPICFQYLGIPVLDDRMNSHSMRHFVDTPLWDRDKSERSWAYYLGDQVPAGSDKVSAYAAPARADDLTGLPPAYVSTMEFDPLRDEGIAYACRLLQAGVSTEIHSYPGTFHGSSVFAHAAICQREAADTLAVLRRGLGVDQ